MAYSADQKQQAISIIESRDGVISDAVLLVVCETLQTNISMRTLYNWWTEYRKQQTASKKRQGTNPAKVPANNPASAKPSAIEIAKVHEQPVEEPLHTGKVTDDVALKKKLRRAAHTFIDAATQEDRMAGMKSDRLMTAAGIAIDKILKLDGIPDFFIDVTVNIYEKTKRYGLPEEVAEKALRDFEAALDNKFAAMITQGSGVN